jgi:hypothetical protein
MPSLDHARDAFAPFAQLEPRLWALWELCRSAAPPEPQAHRDDAYDFDPFELDPLHKPDAGWCAEDYFLHEVKSALLVLVGVYRTRGPHELQTAETYETVYDLLLNVALVRSCACCADRVDDHAAAP